MIDRVAEEEEPSSCFVSLLQSILFDQRLTVNAKDISLLPDSVHNSKESSIVECNEQQQDRAMVRV